MTRPGEGLLAPGVYHRWRKLRRLVLDRQLWCQPCAAAGRKTRGTEVDHIKPLANGGAALDESNCQAICVSCHREKTNSEITARSKNPGVDENGVPLWRRSLPKGMPA